MNLTCKWPDNSNSRFPWTSIASFTVMTCWVFNLMKLTSIYLLIKIKFHFHGIPLVYDFPADRLLNFIRFYDFSQGKNQDGHALSLSFGREPKAKMKVKMQTKQRNKGFFFQLPNLFSGHWLATDKLGMRAWAMSQSVEFQVAKWWNAIFFLKKKKKKKITGSFDTQNFGI